MRLTRNMQEALQSLLSTKQRTLLALIGILIGIGSSYAIAHYSGWEFFVYPPAIALGVGVSSIVGIFFGYYPARQASRLNPIAALRSE